MAGVVWNDNTLHDGYSSSKTSSKQPNGYSLGIVASQATDGIGSVTCKLLRQSGEIQTIVAHPIDANSFTMPLINESVFLFNSSHDSDWYYTGILNNTSNIGYMLNDKITILDDGEPPEETIKKQPTDRNIITPGQTILQSRYGSSILMGAKHDAIQSDWSLDGEDGEPIIIIRNGKSTSPTIKDDSAQIVLTSDQSIPTSAKAPLTFERPDQYVGSQAIIEADRIVFHAKADSLVLSAVDNIGISTNSWAVDVEVLMTQIEALTKAMMALTIPTSLGPGMPINIADFSKVLIELNKMKQ